MNLKVAPARGLRGEIRVPGDKSISHRSIMLASLLDEPIRISGFLRSDDSLRTLDACRQLGASVTEEPGAGGGAGETDDADLVVTGRGSRGLAEPADVIDVGNAGTAIRLLLGLIAPHPVFAVLTGDGSIRRRPMGRVVEPLRRMGARIEGREGGRLAPLAVRGGSLRGLAYRLPVASAQVKSALLLAGLFAEGDTELEEPGPSRDHTERMLQALGADIHREPGRVTLRPGRSLRPAHTHWRVPGDFSSAAFFIVGALITPESDLLIRDVGVNPTRTGLLDVLTEMGGDIRVDNVRDWNGEPVGDIRVRSSSLRRVDVGGALIPRIIDELPVFAVAAAAADGSSRVRDAAELRLKESDRIGGLQEQMQRIGLIVEGDEAGFTVPGGQRARGGAAHSLGDHRLAMALAVAGLASEEGVTVEEPECISASFPGFPRMLQELARGEGTR